MSLINWMIYARKHYQGPRVEFIEEGQPYSSTRVVLEAVWSLPPRMGPASLSQESTHCNLTCAA